MCTPKGTSVLGKTLLPNTFLVSYFFLPCLTSACSTRMQRVATGLLHLPSASTEEQRSQQKETKCSTTAGINTQHCCCLTHFSEQQGPLSDFCRRSAKVKTEEGASFHFQSETLSLGMGAESVNFLLKSERKSSPRSTNFSLRLWSSFKAWKQPWPHHPQSFKRAVRHFQAGLCSALSNFLLLEMSLVKTINCYFKGS